MKKHIVDNHIYSEFRQTRLQRKLFRSSLQRTKQLKNQEQLFLSGEIKNPSIYYILPEKKAIITDQRHLKNFLSKIHTYRDDSLKPQQLNVIKSVYKELAQDKWQRLEVLKNGAVKHDNKSLRIEKEKRFIKANQEVFEKVDKQLWAQLMRKKCKRLSKINDTSAHQAHHYLEEHINWSRLTLNTEHIRKSDHSKDETIRKVVKKYYQILKSVLVQLESTQQVTATELKRYLEQSLIAINCDDWSVDIRSDVKTTRVEYSSKIIVLPKRLRLADDRVRSLIIHEIGVHVLKHKNTRRDGAKALRSGLAGHSDFEEGLAGLLSNIMRSNRKPGGQYLFLATGLALGIDGIKRDFRETYEILYRLLYITKAKNNFTDQQICSKAYHYCVRIFRGCHPDSKGICFLRDKAYYEKGSSILQNLYSLQDAKEIDTTLRLYLSANINWHNAKQVEFHHFVVKYQENGNFI